MKVSLLIRSEQFTSNRILSAETRRVYEDTDGLISLHWPDVQSRGVIRGSQQDIGGSVPQCHHLRRKGLTGDGLGPSQTWTQNQKQRSSEYKQKHQQRRATHPSTSQNFIKCLSIITNRRNVSGDGFRMLNSNSSNLFLNLKSYQSKYCKTLKYVSVGAKQLA